MNQSPLTVSSGRPAVSDFENGVKPSLLRMGLLVDTVQKLSMAKDLESVMMIVRAVARELTGADGATFVLREGDFCHYAEENAISPLWKGSRFPMKTCISGWAMLNKTHVIIKDIEQDPRIPIDAYRPTFVKSLAIVPIRTMDPIGAIGNYWADHHVVTEEEVTALQALADITAVSIENIEVRNTLEDKVLERTRELADSLDREREFNELKSAFVSMASHEFRTPLSTILTSVSLAEKYTDAEQQDKRAKHYARIRSSVHNLTGLLNDFLSLEKLEQGKLIAEVEGFDLDEFLEEVIADVDGMRKQGQQISYQFEGDRNVSLDKKILRNIMLNLLSNAIKYSDREIDLDAQMKDAMVTITVKDRGIGIPEDQHHELFGKFFRASNASSIQGTGLGLNIVRQYVALLNGNISFVSKVGVGTTFTVCLPAIFSRGTN